jgi:hypothetical protein
VPAKAYSERFLHHSAKGAWRYTVPSGMRAIVTSVDAVCAQPVVPCDLSLRIGPILSVYVVFPVAWRTETRAVRQVAYQGEVLELNISEGGLHVTICGYLLIDTTDRTGPPLAAAQLPAGGEGEWLNPDLGERDVLAA